jgi:hypothetical protein
MSEKKTAEIKLRIEPSVKAQWQQAAADEGIGLSEWIVRSCADRRSVNNALIEGSQIGYLKAMEKYGPFAEPDPGGPRSEFRGEPFPHVFTTGGYSLAPSVAPDPTVTTNPVPANTGEKKFGEDWKPWGGA